VIYFEDESSISLNVFTGKTWAPRGKTPVIHRSGQRVKRTLASAVSTEGELYFQALEGSMTGPRYVQFLAALSATSENPIFVIHDGLPAHRAKVVTEHIEASEGKLRLFQLPGYSPELNPDELVWMNLKRELGKRAHKNIDEMSQRADRYLRKLRRNKSTLKGFVTHTYGVIEDLV